MTLAGAAVSVLATGDASAKAEASRAAAALWQSDALREIGSTLAPDRPARPLRPELKPPRDMPRRRAAGSLPGRIALLHALAHIELNAIDLAWDIVARFAGADLPRAFYDDWVAVADDEARHFLLLQARLAALGAAYGDLPAHDGLWQAALDTRHDLLARLAIVPLVLEARGLDVTPTMIAQFARNGDADSAAILQIIYRDEIGHVAAGRRWFEWMCAERGVEPIATWRALVARHFKGALKPPFNDAARQEAGFGRAYWRIWDRAAAGAPSVEG
ncbi:MAG: ferritin-like domain-containing protein [Rhodospirillaceae bacterium]|nr:ferritin-like domain-containing protein [Rhodospirillaceae bacterium]